MHHVSHNIYHVKHNNIVYSNFKYPFIYATRQRDHFYRPKVRLTSSLNSLNFTGMRKWNQLPTAIKLNSTLSCFKKLCRKCLFVTIFCVLCVCSSFYMCECVCMLTEFNLICFLLGPYLYLSNLLLCGPDHT